MKGHMKRGREQQERNGRRRVGGQEWKRKGWKIK